MRQAGEQRRADGLSGPLPEPAPQIWLVQQGSAVGFAVFAPVAFDRCAALFTDGMDQPRLIQIPRGLPRPAEAKLQVALPVDAGDVVSVRQSGLAAVGMPV